MEIIAHRGESYLAPENTMAAIQMAWDKGATAVEIDVHLTADNEVVVIHDKHTARTGDRRLVVARATAGELKSVDAGSKKDPQYRGERIPLLREVLKTIPADGKLIVEIKCDRRVIPFLSRVIKESGVDDTRVEIISFDYTTACTAKEVMPQHKTLWIFNPDYYLPLRLIPAYHKRIIQKLKANNLDGINVRAGNVVTEKFVSTFREHNLVVYLWTVNEPSLAARLIKYGVDGIITDRAGWLRQQLSILQE